MTTTMTLAGDHEAGFDLLTEHVARALPARGGPVEVVEAGCGRSWVLGDLGSEIRLTGIDLDEEALRLRVEERGDLDIAIHGDLLTVDVEPSSYDLVFSSFVLEHLEHPERALERFFAWLRPDGLVAIVIPDKDTAKGFATRFSPFFLHVWYYRWIKGRKTAGKPGFEPYRTHYGDVVSRKGVRTYCADNGHRVVAEIAIAMNRDDDGRFTTIVAKALSVLSFGKLRDDYCNIAFVLAKEASR